MRVRDALLVLEHELPPSKSATDPSCVLVSTAASRPVKGSTPVYTRRSMMVAVAWPKPMHIVCSP